MLPRRRRPRALTPAGLLALALAAEACAGSPPPPRRDLASALEKTAGVEAMFEFSLQGRIGFSRDPVVAVSPEPAAEFYAVGSGRPGRGFRMTVQKRPAMWHGGPRGYAVSAGADVSTPGAQGPPRAEGMPGSWLVLEEIPGAVRAPGQPLWFAGRSGAMDAFGGLAHALPPLGSPDTVLTRLRSLLSRFRDPEFSGQSEVRGHPVDVYSLTVPPEKARPPDDVLEARESGGRSPSPFRTSAPSPSPSPTSPDGSLRVPLSEAVWMLVYGETPASELTAAIEADVAYSLLARAYVDQIDNMVRRVDVSLGVKSPGTVVRVEAVAEYWGFDTVGEFRVPVDTTFVSPEGQEAIRAAGFPVTAPSPPPGLEFTGLERRPGANLCEPLSMSYTGRGRAGHMRLAQVPATCGPLLPPPPASETQPGAPATVTGRESFTVTDTPLGSRLLLRRDGESMVALRELENSWVTARSDGGISVEELFSSLDGLVPLSVPIPPELSLPLPQEGPERR